MTAIVIRPPQPGHGCDACPFPTRYMAAVRIINPFGAQYYTDANYCWPCFERWLEDSDHNVEVGPKEHSKPTIIPPTYNLMSGMPVVPGATFWRRADVEP